MGTGAVFELVCNRETKMGVRASGISNQNTHQMIPDNTHWNRWNTEYTRIRFSAFADAREQSRGHDCRGGHYFIFFLPSFAFSPLSKPFKSTLVFKTPSATTTTLTTNDHCNHNKAIVSRRHRITTLPVTHRHGPNIRHNICPNIHHSSDRCVADLHLYGTLEAK